MRSRSRFPLVALAAALTAAPPLAAQDAPPASATRFAPMDVFGLEFASDPQVSPDGARVVYVRNFFDVMTDRRRSNLWILDVDGGRHRALTTGNENDASPRWSPDGDRLVYASGRGEGATQLWVRWMDTGEEARVTNLTRSPGGLSWSPDGRWIAFTMFVPEREDALAVELPTAPQGAEWADPARVVDDLQYRADGAGWLEDGHTHVFVVPAEGGTPRQLTFGPHDHGGTPAWTPDGGYLVVSGNRHGAPIEQGADSELYEIRVSDGRIRALTDRFGPDGSPAVSPDGRRIAFTGYDDRLQGYQTSRLYVMDRDGGAVREIATGLDRDVADPAWSADGRGLFVQYDDEGNTKIAWVPVEGGEPVVLTGDVGGVSYGRPYGGGSFSASRGGRVAFTHTRPDHPADVAVVDRARPGQARRLTRLNDDLLAHKELGEVEEIWWESSADGRPVQGWIVKPPGFDPARRYPLVLEIHGGPFSNYGDRFSAEILLMAAKDYVVLYANPRGSTSYGEAFGNLIHHAYPSQDYDDLMSGVDAVIERGYVDPDQLFVTGGSGGGVLTAWIVGKTDRFRAAVVAKPVINWTSFVLTADGIPFFYRYWFPGPPWEHPEHYWERSPLSLVGDVATPTMLLTGESDYRTPMSETEQYYAALQLREVPSVMVRIPGAGHGIVNRPSNLVTKVAYILAWFEKWRDAERMATDR